MMQTKAGSKSFLLTILVGLLIRELLAPFTGHPFDFEIWIRLGYYVSQGSDPYQFTNPIPNLSIPGTGRLPSIGYPPLWAFIQASMYMLYRSFGVENRFFYYFIIKQTTVLPDVALAVLLYQLVKPYSKEKANLALRFWMFCPYTIIISAMWGIFDQFTLLAVIVSILLFQKTIRSSLFEGIGIFLKGIPIIFLPFLSFYGRQFEKSIIYVTISSGITIVFSLMPYLIFPNWNIQSLIGSATDTIHKVGNSMNYWVIYYVLNNYYKLPTSVYMVIRITGYAWIPAVIIGSIFCITGQKNKFSLAYLNACLLFISLIFLLTRTQINEQYLIYFLGFGLINVTAFDNKQWKLFSCIWLSALVFLLANNFFLIRFLSPISINYTDLENSLANGQFANLRMIMMAVSGISFSFFSFKYLVTVYRQLVSLKKSDKI